MINRWRELVAEFGGTRVAVLYVLHRMLQRVSGGGVAIVPYLLVAQPIANPFLAGIRPDPNTVVRRIAADDPVISEFPRSRQVVAQRFAEGAECFVVWVRGSFAGHIWIARGRYVEDEVRCIYEIADPGTGVWDFDVYVKPSMRVGRTMGRMWKAVDEALAVEGIRWSYSRINQFNGASVRSHQRLGAVTLGRVVFATAGTVQLCFGLHQPWRGQILTAASERWPRFSLRA